jgi:hypothetical protein
MAAELARAPDRYCDLPRRESAANAGEANGAAGVANCVVEYFSIKNAPRPFVTHLPVWQRLGLPTK